MKPVDAEEDARDAAEAWLAHVDAGDVAASHQDASSTFRKAVTPEQWGDSLGRVQEALGKPLERAFRSAEYHSELPGAPDGHYVVLTYATRFARKEHGVETVTPQLDTDGVWRVSGYFVK